MYLDIVQKTKKMQRNEIEEYAQTFDSYGMDYCVRLSQTVKAFSATLHIVSAAQIFLAVNTMRVAALALSTQPLCSPLFQANFFSFYASLQRARLKIIICCH